MTSIRTKQIKHLKYRLHVAASNLAIWEREEKEAPTEETRLIACEQVARLHREIDLILEHLQSMGRGE